MLSPQGERTGRERTAFELRSVSVFNPFISESNGFIIPVGSRFAQPPLLMNANPNKSLSVLGTFFYCVGNRVLMADSVCPSTRD